MHTMTPQQAYQRAAALFPFAGRMAAKLPERSVYATIAAAASRHLGPGSRILDFGCGACDKTAVLQFLGFKCAGYDDLQDAWHQIPSNRQQLFDYIATCGIDFRLAAPGPLPFERGSFDAVMLLDVLEHLHDSPRELMNDLLELVADDGLLIITVPNAGNLRKRVSVLTGGTNMQRFGGFYWYPGQWRGHVREYVFDDLQRLCEYLGLDVLELRGCDHMVDAKLGGLARTTYLALTTALNGCKDTWLLVARKKPGWVPVRSLPETTLAAMLASDLGGVYEPWMAAARATAAAD